MIGLLAAAALALPAPASAAPTPSPSASLVDRTVTDARVAESSGLAVSSRHDGVLWTHDDSGNAPLLFAIGRSGRIAGTVRVTGVPDVDWEAMAAFRDAAGRPLLAVADTGDNLARRAGVEIDVVPEPARLGTTSSAPLLRLKLRYPDGARDAEALLVDRRRGRMFLVTKGLLGGRAYAVPASAWDGTAPARPATRTATLVPVGTVPLVFVTDGTVTPDGAVLLRTYGDLAVLDPLPTEPGDGLLAPRSTDGLPGQRQGEGLALAPDGDAVLLSSEGARQPVLRVPLPDDTRAALTAAAPPPSPTPSPGSGPTPSPGVSRTPSPTSSPSPAGSSRPSLATGVLVLGALALLAGATAVVVAVLRRR